MNFCSSCFCLPSTGTTGRHHHAAFTGCWGSNPGLQAWTSTLPNRAMSPDPTSVFQLSKPIELRERPPVLFIRVDPFEQPNPVELLPSLLECLSFPVCFPGLIAEKGRGNGRESQHCSLRTTNMHRAPLQYLEIRYPWVPSIGGSRPRLVEPIL